MMYLSGVVGPKVRPYVVAQQIGVMNSQAIGYVVDGVYACDNGRFGNGWKGADHWWTWLQRATRRDDPGRCLFAVAPDIPYDSRGTLRESTPWLSRIRGIGVPAAFACQNGSEHPGMIPWDDLDVVFLAGDTKWKLGPEAADISLEAAERGKTVHMARVNSHRRLDHAHNIGARTCDGTFLAFAPDVNIPRMLGWLDRLNRRQPLGVQFGLPGMPT